MAFKFVVFAILLAAANAGLIAAPAATSYSSSSVSHGSGLSYNAPAYKIAAPVAQYSYAAPALKVATPVAQYSYAAPGAYAAPIHKTIVAEQYAPAHYDFEYSVQDPHTGDFKSQKEVREGDAVHGSYSLVEADGSKRIVEYTADDHSGFNAIVHREPAAHPVAVKAVAPVVKYAAPVAQYSAAPVAQYSAAPIAHYSAAPVAHYSAAPVAHYSAAPVAHYSAAPVAHYSPAPVAHYSAAPVAHYSAAPVAHYSSAPVAHYSAAPSVSYASYAAPAHVLHH